MAHVLKMAIVDWLRQLRALNWSARRIARYLEIDRGAVWKYLEWTNSVPRPAPAKRSITEPNGDNGPDAGACESQELWR